MAPVGDTPATTPAAQPATSPQTPAPAETGEQKQDQPQYVTKEMLAEAIEQGVRRAQQSAADRTRNVENRVKELTATLSKFVPVTPEIEAKAREQAQAEVDAQPADPSQEATPQGAGEPGQGNPVFDVTQGYFQEIGMTVEKSDPEWKAIQQSLDDPNGSMAKYMVTLQKAVTAKQVRVSEQSAAAPARVVGGGSSATGAPANSAKDYYDRVQYKNK